MMTIYLEENSYSLSCQPFINNAPGLNSLSKRFLHHNQKEAANDAAHIYRVFLKSILIKYFQKIFCGTKRFHIFVKPKGFINIMRRDVFQAIADPTRRKIINMIAHKPLNVNSVAGKFEVSRAAIYKHVKILTECGIIVIKQHGRERYYVAQMKKLNKVSD